MPSRVDTIDLVNVQVFPRRACATCAAKIHVRAVAANSQGIPVDALVREYQLLRDGMVRYLRERLDPADALTALDGLNAMLDKVVVLAVAEYAGTAGDEPGSNG